MEQWLIPALILVALAAGLGYFVWRSIRRSEPALNESYFGPLPDREADQAELTDPARFGQVTPGAVTPAAAGSPEQYYQATGVGQGGPRHLSGPPPTTFPASAQEERDPSKLIPLIAAGGAVFGLAVAALVRRLTRRRSRLEALRDRARRAADTVQHRAVEMGGRAADLREQVDGRKTTGSGLAFLAATLLLASMRRWQERQAAERLAEEERLAAEAERSRRWSRLKHGLGSFRSKNGASSFEKAAGAVGTIRATERAPRLLFAGALGLAVLIGLLVGRANRRPEADWWTANVPDSAPARETPASP
jgi:hypothetical protein